MSIETCSNPIFIIGSPRSGTSILAWSLAKHRQLWTSTEFFMMVYLFGGVQINTALQKNDSEMPWCWLREQNVSHKEFLSYLGTGFNALMTSRSQGKRWIDQTPAHTMMADTLADMFPNAFFIHILRDGRRVVNSLVNWNHPNRKKEDAGWKLDFESSCGIWKTFAETALDFCNRHPERSLTVVNEKLATNPRREFHEIFERLGIPYQDQPINYFQSTVLNSSFQSATHVPHKVEPWKEWTDEQNEIFSRKAGNVLEQYRIAKDDWYSLRQSPNYRLTYAIQ